MTILVALPLIVPLATAIFSFALPWAQARRIAAVAGAVALLGSAIALAVEVTAEEILVLEAGAWPAPYGIALVADGFSAIMVLVAAVIGLAAVAYSLGSIEPERERFGYYALVHILLMGVCGAFLTGDLFNLYVWFEVLLISSFVLLAFGGGREQMEGALKYVVLNLVSSTLFLTGIGLLYGSTGTLNMADLSRQLATSGDDGFMSATSMLFLVAFAIKAAMFPLFFWLPASYHVAPPAVAALFAGLLTKVGVYALVRTFTLIFIGDTGYSHTVLLWLSVATMVTGVLGAVAHTNINRILSFHIISQVGYMTLGLALHSPLALAASIFYLVHHIIVKANLFLVAGMIERATGSLRLQETGGLLRARPLLALLFFVPAFSLGGIPPLSGFFAKLAIVSASFERGEWVAGAAALAVGLLTLLSMTKIWVEAFLKPIPAGRQHTQSSGRGLAIPVALLALLTVGIGLGAEPVYRAAEAAADQLSSREAYIEAVLGGPS